jgi:hypothetical protein
MANTNHTGPTDLPTFKAGGGWKIGWAYSCVLAPGGTAAFTITVVSDPGAVANPTAAVETTGRSGSGVTPQTSTGQQHLKVATDPACKWAIKVTGVAG